MIGHATVRFCSQCGAQRAADSRFCDNCGHAFGASAQTQEVATGRASVGRARSRPVRRRFPILLVGSAILVLVVGVGGIAAWRSGVLDPAPVPDAAVSGGAPAVQAAPSPAPAPEPAAAATEGGGEVEDWKISTPLQRLQAVFECRSDLEKVYEHHATPFLFDDLRDVTTTITGERIGRFRGIDVDEETPDPVWTSPAGLVVFGLTPATLWQTSGYDGQAGVYSTFAAPKSVVIEAVKRRWPKGVGSDSNGDFFWQGDDFRPVTVSSDGDGRTRVLCGG